MKKPPILKNHGIRFRCGSADFLLSPSNGEGFYLAVKAGGLPENVLRVQAVSSQIVYIEAISAMASTQWTRPKPKAKRRRLDDTEKR
jgi:hypothetical protein